MRREKGKNRSIGKTIIEQAKQIHGGVTHLYRFNIDIKDNPKKVSFGSMFGDRFFEKPKKFAFCSREIQGKQYAAHG